MLIDIVVAKKQILKNQKHIGFNYKKYSIKIQLKDVSRQR